nr:AlNc14C68G4750 [Albugo laibachii Nc14]|eukprot:CCA19306.1 AlNc14C68G4750 [Albugo laibachii Nc14]
MEKIPRTSPNRIGLRISGSRRARLLDAGSSISWLRNQAHRILDYMEQGDSKTNVKWSVDALEPPAFKWKIVEKLEVKMHKMKKRNPMVIYKWCQDLLLRSFMEWEPETTRRGIHQRVDFKEAEPNRYSALCSKLSVICAGRSGVAVQTTKSAVEKRVDDKSRAKKAARCGNSGEVMATVDGVENIKTLLDAGSDCRIVSVGLVDTLLL